MMKIYRIAQDFSNNAELEKSNQELQLIIKDFEVKYPGIELWVFENEFKIHISELRVPLEMRHQGIGSEIIKKIKEFAAQRGKPLTLAPQPEYGYKKKLDDFYRGHGFVPNKGRKKDYRISDPFARTMYWKPSQVN